MDKKVLGYLLIALGALDYLIWILNGLSFGWLELIVGVNIISQYGAAFLITIGIILIKNEKAESMSEVDLINDLDKGEEVIFKNIGDGVIIVITNKKVIIWQSQYNTSWANNYENVYTDEKLSFPYDSIESVKPVKNSEINKTIDFIHTKFGISFKMKDGSVKNIRTFKSELISAYINKQLQVNE
jgi:hypothetical protein